MIDQDELGDKCDHDPCHCVPNAESAISDEKKRIFCSPGCARGEGCTHDECNCANA